MPQHTKQRYQTFFNLTLAPGPNLSQHILPSCSHFFLWCSKDWQETSMSCDWMKLPISVLSLLLSRLRNSVFFLSFNSTADRMQWAFWLSVSTDTAVVTMEQRQSTVGFSLSACFFSPLLREVPILHCCVSQTLPIEIVKKNLHAIRCSLFFLHELEEQGFTSVKAHKKEGLTYSIEVSQWLYTKHTVHTYIAGL